VRLAPSPLAAPLPRRSERKPSGIPSVTVEPTVRRRSVPAFLLRTPGGGRRYGESRGAHSVTCGGTGGSVGGKGRGGTPSRLSAGGYLASPVMFAKPKGIPVEGRGDFLRGKGGEVGCLRASLLDLPDGLVVCLGRGPSARWRKSVIPQKRV
jgi:hypothetical protein